MKGGTMNLGGRSATAWARRNGTRTAPGKAALLMAAASTALTLNVACRRGERQPSPATRPSTSVGATAAPAPVSPPAGGTADEISVLAKGQPWVSVVRRGEMVTVSAGDVRIVGQRRADGKRKYSAIAGGPVLLEVKPRSADEAGSADATEGFKLRDSGGKLLWKVKVGADKIKISPDEDGTRAFVVSSKHAPLVTVQGPDGQALGTIRANPGNNELTGEDALGVELFRAATDLPARDLGVLLLEGVPLRERGVILAELAARAPAR
jgi:hypothetical protein